MLFCYFNIILHDGVIRLYDYMSRLYDWLMTSLYYTTILSWLYVILALPYHISTSLYYYIHIWSCYHIIILLYCTRWYDCVVISSHDNILLYCYLILLYSIIMSYYDLTIDLYNINFCHNILSCCFLILFPYSYE